MLNGKALPKAVRGFRMVLTALLQPIIMSGKTTAQEIKEKLKVAQLSRTGLTHSSSL